MTSFQQVPFPSSDVDIQLFWSPNVEGEFILVTDTIYYFRICHVEEHVVPNMSGCNGSYQWSEFVGLLQSYFPDIGQSIQHTDTKSMYDYIFQEKGSSDAQVSYRSHLFEQQDSYKLGTSPGSRRWAVFDEGCVVVHANHFFTNFRQATSIAWRPVNVQYESVRMLHAEATSTLFSSTSVSLITVCYDEAYVVTIELFGSTGLEKPASMTKKYTGVSVQNDALDNFIVRLSNYNVKGDSEAAQLTPVASAYNVNCQAYNPVVPLLAMNSGRMTHSSNLYIDVETEEVVIAAEVDPLNDMDWLPAHPMVLVGGSAKAALVFYDVRTTLQGKWCHDSLLSTIDLRASTVWDRRSALVNTMIPPNYLDSLTGRLLGKGACHIETTSAISHVSMDHDSKVYVGTTDATGIINIWDIRFLSSKQPLVSIPVTGATALVFCNPNNATLACPILTGHRNSACFSQYIAPEATYTYDSVTAPAEAGQSSNMRLTLSVEMKTEREVQHKTCVPSTVQHVQWINSHNSHSLFNHILADTFVQAGTVSMDALSTYADVAIPRSIQSAILGDDFLTGTNAQDRSAAQHQFNTLSLMPESPNTEDKTRRGVRGVMLVQQKKETQSRILDIGALLTLSRLHSTPAILRPQTPWSTAPGFAVTRIGDSLMVPRITKENEVLKITAVPLYPRTSVVQTHQPQEPLLASVLKLASAILDNVYTQKSCLQSLRALALLYNVKEQQTVTTNPVLQTQVTLHKSLVAPYVAMQSSLLELLNIYRTNEYAFIIDSQVQSTQKGNKSIFVPRPDNWGVASLQTCVRTCVAQFHTQLTKRTLVSRLEQKLGFDTLGNVRVLRSVLDGLDTMLRCFVLLGVLSLQLVTVTVTLTKATTLFAQTSLTRDPPRVPEKTRTQQVQALTQFIETPVTDTVKTQLFSKLGYSLLAEYSLEQAIFEFPCISLTSILQPFHTVQRDARNRVLAGIQFNHQLALFTSQDVHQALHKLQYNKEDCSNICPPVYDLPVMTKIISFCRLLASALPHTTVPTKASAPHVLDMHRFLAMGIRHIVPLLQLSPSLEEPNRMLVHPARAQFYQQTPAFLSNSQKHRFEELSGWSVVLPTQVQRKAVCQSIHAKLQEATESLVTVLVYAKRYVDAVVQAIQLQNTQMLSSVLQAWKLGKTAVYDESCPLFPYIGHPDTYGYNEALQATLTSTQVNAPYSAIHPYITQAHALLQSPTLTHSAVLATSFPILTKLSIAALYLSDDQLEKLTQTQLPNILDATAVAGQLADDQQCQACTADHPVLKLAGASVATASLRDSSPHAESNYCVCGACILCVAQRTSTSLPDGLLYASILALQANMQTVPILANSQHCHSSALIERVTLTTVGELGQLLKRANMNIRKTALHVQRTSMLNVVAHATQPYVLQDVILMLHKNKRLTDADYTTFYSNAGTMTTGDVTDMPLSTQGFQYVPRCTLCYNPLALNTKNCSNCTKQFPLCVLCFKPVCLKVQELPQVGTSTTVPLLENNAPTNYTWCTKCKHGGHLEHIDAWFKQYDACPVTGCECLCKVPFK